MIIERRSFLLGMLALGMSPGIVRASSLMPTSVHIGGRQYMFQRPIAVGLGDCLKIDVFHDHLLESQIFEIASFQIILGAEMDRKGLLTLISQ